jgi:hypothetical protein
MQSLPLHGCMGESRWCLAALGLLRTLSIRFARLPLPISTCPKPLAPHMHSPSHSPTHSLSGAPHLPALHRGRQDQLGPAAEAASALPAERERRARPHRSRALPLPGGWPQTRLKALLPPIAPSCNPPAGPNRSRALPLPGVVCRLKRGCFLLTQPPPTLTSFNNPPHLLTPHSTPLPHHPHPNPFRSAA